ncbi:hypothetical protein EB061_13545, partial [bacterium]|nr:hypothetical protein [bacterium]
GRDAYVLGGGMEIAGRTRRLGREQRELHGLPQVTVYELGDSWLGGVKQVGEGQTASVCKLEVRVVDHELKGVDDRAAVAYTTDAVLSSGTAAWTPESVALLGESKKCLTKDGFIHHPLLQVSLEVRDGATAEWITPCVVWVSEDGVSPDVSVPGNRSTFSRTRKLPYHGLPLWGGNPLTVTNFDVSVAGQKLCDFSFAKVVRSIAV